MTLADQRAHISAIHDWLVQHAAHIGYAQVRPMATRGLFEQELASRFARATSGQKVISPDCSEMQTLVCRLAGLQDPTGLGYGGYGNTNSMFSHLRHSDPAGALVGALCVFGPANATVHVAAVHKPDRTNPMMFNHGTSAGPHYVRFADLAAAVRGPATFLDISPL